MKIKSTLKLQQKVLQLIWLLERSNDFVPNDKIFAITQPNTGTQLLKSEKCLSSQGNFKELTSYCALHSL